MGGVFISYRRTDSDVAAGRLADDLSEIFGPGRVFRDIDSLEAGEDFPRALERALDSCTVVIALIGPRWSSVVSDTGQRRLDDPKDWVRLEIARALQRDIRVIPVLLSTTMPKESELPADLEPLLRRNAVDLTDRYWKQEVEELARALERIPGFGVRAGAPVAARVFNLRPVLIAVAVLAIVALGWWLASRQP
ncbi:MAG TPA: toll/interleukin-1 receptor domain-containing protein, partial [Vicinamibacterales bacterium]|nr:toll/interleukin-1 receptor domain-containing protein [Vicinamibacterales bacterium]